MSHTKKILSGKSIDVFNKGKMKRDFTFIDDAVNATYKIIHKIPKINRDNNMIFELVLHKLVRPYFILI